MKIPVRPGDRLDHYQIEDIAEHRGTTSVFRATDLRTNHPVAIKIPDFDMESDPIAIERFQREEEIGRSLDHRGILKVFGDGERSQTYIVSEWFAGRPLRAIVGEKALSQERSVRIALNVADALAYLQNHGIVHRDLRPENVLVDEQDNIKLVNFGLAGKTGARRITFTNLAQVAGFSEYISPEELNGKRGDARSDIYSLGVMLYEMLTAKLPFQTASSYDRLTKDPIPPREFNPAITPQVQEIIYRALERQPRNRYANAVDFARDLRQPEHIGTIALGERSPVAKQPARNWRKVALYAAIAMIPLAIFALLLYVASH